MANITILEAFTRSLTSTKSYIDKIAATKVDKVDGKGLSTNDLTDTLKSNYETAYAHSQAAHAPVDAQKNSDITKAEIEAKLTGNITSHTHSQYLTSVPAEYITETELNAKRYLTEHQDISGLAPKANPSFTGNATVAGKVTVGTTPTEDMDVATKKYVDDKVPYYNETLKFEISGEDYSFFYNNSYCNMNVLNLDETKIYVGEEKFNENNLDYSYVYYFVYDKEADALICEIYGTYIYNHKSCNGTNFIKDENSAVLTSGITPMNTSVSEVKGYFRLYEAEKLELDTNCLSDNLRIKNSLTVGNRIGNVGVFSVAEGVETTASGTCSHAEGGWTTANGDGSHAEGNSTTASGENCHAEGVYTIATSANQHVQGKYNIEDTTGTYAHIVGNGTSKNARSNAHTLDWNGNAWFKGKVSIDGTPTEDKDLVTKKYVDDTIANGGGTSSGSAADYGPYSIQYNSVNNRLEFIYTPTN